jgi:hypothetical protein
MDQRSQGNPGKLLIEVIKVVNARNELKRYTLVRVQQAA